MFRSAVEHAGLTLDLDCPDLGEPAFVDRGMWEQVVLTLLAHALAVSSAGRITVTLGRESGSAVLRIADTGRTPRCSPRTAGSGWPSSRSWWACSAAR